MKLAIHQPHYMPWCGYFHKIASADLFVLLDDVQFKKNEWQHRNRIRSSQGAQLISVPNHYLFPQRINEVRINNQEPWQEKHWRTLVAAYGKASCFTLYKEEFQRFYAGSWELLAALNIDSVKLLARLLGIQTPMELSSPHQFQGSSTERLVNICRHFGADIYLSGVGGKEYMDLGLFEKAGIRVEFQEFVNPVYVQHWSRSAEDFIPALSVIDALFNCGERSLGLIMGKK
jgi:hypothetical protein